MWPTHRLRISRIVAAVLLLMLLAPARAQLLPITWSGTGNWTDTARWSLGLVPAATNSAQIASGTVTLSDARSVGAIAFSGGSLIGTGTLTLVSTGSTWTAGTMNSAGALVIQSGADLTLGDTSAKDFNTRTITNLGTVNWQGGDLRSGNSGAIVNQGNFNDSTAGVLGAQDLNNDYGGTWTFTNAATGNYTKSGSGTTRVYSIFNNNGAVSIQAGALNLNGGGTHTGSVAIGSGATFGLDGGTHTFSADSLINGSGTLSVSGSTANFNGTIGGGPNIILSSGTANFNGTSNTTGGGTYSGGTLSGTGTLTHGAAITLNGTTLTGAGILNADGGTTISGTFSFNGSRTLNLGGNSTWSSGYLYAGGNSVITVKPGATFTTTNNNTINGTYYGGGAATTAFNNQGTFTKSTSTGTTDITAVFNNTGTVNVQAGTLDLGGGGTHSGTIDISSGATLALTSDTHTFSSGAVVNGAGNLRVSGGTTTFNGATTGSANIVIAGGNAAFNGTTNTTGGGTFSGGTLSGTGTLTHGAAITLNGTTLTGAGILNADAGATINGTFSFNGGRTLNLAGNSTWTTGYIYGGGNSVITVKPGATFTTTANNTINGTYYGGGAATTVFNNQGTFTKSTSTGTTDITAVFNNTGTVNVQAGTLDLGGGGTHSGTVDISSGATLALTGGTHSFSSGAAINGAGNLRVSGGTAAFSGATTGSANIVITGGTAAFNGTTNTTGGGTFSGGTFSGTGNLTLGALLTLSGATLSGNGTVAANGGVAITSSFSLKDGQSLSLVGNSTWSAATIYHGNGGTLTNTGTFTNTGNSTLYHYYSGEKLTFHNSGTFIKSGATGTTDLNAVFNNSGLVNVQAGTLDLGGGGTHSGTVDVSSGATLALTGGTHTFSTGATINGAGSLKVSGGTTTFNGATTGSANIVITGGTATFSGITNTTGGGTFSSGTFNGTGNLTLGALLTLSGTTLSGNGTVAANGGVAITNSFSLKDGQKLTLVGNSTWSAATLYHGNGGTLTNTGTFTNTGNSTLYHYYSGEKLTFHNSGTFIKSGATGTTDLNAPFHNTGAVQVQAGILDFGSGGTSSGTVAISSGATLLVSNGFDFVSAAQISGAGLLRLTSGNLTLSGTLGVTTLTLDGGRLLGSQTFPQTVNWNHTNLDASAAGSTTTIASGGVLTLSTGGNKDFNYRTLLNAAGGTIYWNIGHLRSGSGGALTNHGDFYDRNASSYSIYNPGFGGTYTFNNYGNYFRESGGTTYLDAVFNNFGTVTLTAGDLRLQEGGTMGATSVVNAATGTHLYFLSNYTLLDGAQFLGAGEIIQSSGTLTLDGVLRAPLFTWSGGDWNAPAVGATTTIGSGTTLLLTNGGNKAFNRRAITIASGATVDWQSGHLQGGNGSVFTNNGTFLDKNVSSYSIYNPGFGGTYRFDNNGIYTRSTSGTTYLDVVFNNTGTINLNAGDLRLQGGGTMSATSIVNAAAGTHLYFLDDYRIAHGAKLQGAGAFIHSSGKLDIDGALVASTFDWLGGNWNAPAAALTSIANGTTLTLDSGGYKDFDYRSITIAAGGVIEWKSGHLRGGHGSVLTNQGTFHDKNVSSYSVIAGTSGSGLGGAFTFVNQGTYLRDVGGVTYFTAPFENHGTVTLSAGRIELDGGGTMGATSVVNAAAGTQLYFTDNYTLLSGAQLNGAGTYLQTAGTLTIDGALKAGSFTWSGGNWNAASSGLTTTLASGTTVTVNGGANKDFNRRTLEIAAGGTLLWQSGHLRSGNGGAIVNHGTFNDQNVSGYDIMSPATSGLGGTFTFTNNGTYSKTTTGTTHINVPFANNGTLSISAGSVVFNSTFTNSGNLALSGGATLQSSGTISLGTSALTGTGTIQAASVTAGGLVSPGNSAGTLTLTGNLTLLATSNLLFELGGGTAGTGYDVLNVGGAAALAGNLSLQFLNGYQFSVTPGATFTVFTASGAGGLTGSFANIGNGQNLLTSDGAAIFRVNYGTGSAFAANSIVLSHFVAVPEPSTYVMLGLGAALILWQVRRRRN